MARSKTKLLRAQLIRAERMNLSRNGNPRWMFVTDKGTYTTGVDYGCAYKGEPRQGEPIELRLDNGRRPKWSEACVLDYGWGSYPLNLYEGESFDEVPSEEGSA